MIAFVTGGTGFVGGHVVRALLDRGARVRCLVRGKSRRDNLDGLPVEVVVGDLRDEASLRQAMAGTDVVFHCAADYRLYVPTPDVMYASNVDGTRNIMKAAADCGVGRVVYTSTVGTLGLASDGGVADERTPVRLADMVGHYKRSKFLAERVAEEWSQRGLPVVIVNPSAPVGDLDVKPTATGQMVLDFLNGKLNAYVDTGLNVVDVRDVALGHVLAAEKGRIGEKYILGNENLSLKQIFDVLAGITGVASPRIKLPHWIPLTVSAIDTLSARIVRGRPRWPLDAVRLSRHKMFFDAGKAVRELGLPQTPVTHALERAVAWFRARGYARGASVQ